MEPTVKATRMRRLTPVKAAAAWLALLLAGAPAAAQEPASSPGPTLTLEEALRLARANNPELLSQVNSESVAEWGVREAYGALLPGASVSSAFQYQAPGETRFGIFTGGDLGVAGGTGYYLSDYTLGFNYGLSGADLFRVGQEKANRRAVRAQTDATRYTLQSAITTQYFLVLRAAEAAAVTERRLESATENLKLARARVQVGAAIPLEEIQAEVQRGRVEVELLRARSAERIELLRLSQQMGVALDSATELTSRFEVFTPPWQVETLVATALDANPVLRAQRARERASEAAVKMAKSAYLPRLDMNFGWSGFAREASNSEYVLNQARGRIAEQREGCQLFNAISTRLNEPLPGFPADCAAIALTPEQEAQLRASNDVFPFDYTGQPFSARLQVSLPLFSGFTRQRQVEAARVQEENLEYQLRGEELRVRADVVAAYDAVATGAQVAQLEARNLEGAREQLRLARELYRVGASTFVELLEAETLLAQAENSYIVAVYDFHEAVAALEAVVGRPLRTEPRGEESEPSRGALG